MPAMSGATAMAATRAATTRRDACEPESRERNPTQGWRRELRQGRPAWDALASAEDFKVWGGYARAGIVPDSGAIFSTGFGATAGVLSGSTSQAAMRAANMTKAMNNNMM